MGTQEEIKELERELKENHLSRINDNTPNISYFKLMKREVEILNRLKEISPAPKEEKLKEVAPDWTKEEEKYLLENYESMTGTQLEEKLGRTVAAIRSKWRKIKDQ